MTDRLFSSAVEFESGSNGESIGAAALSGVVGAVVSGSFVVVVVSGSFMVVVVSGSFVVVVVVVISLKVQIHGFSLVRSASIPRYVQLPVFFQISDKFPANNPVETDGKMEICEQRYQ